MKLLLTTILSLVIIFSLAAQENIFEGVVIGMEDFKPIQNASIKLKNTLQGTQTDSLGKFYLKTPKPNMSIEISCIGFKKETVLLSKSQFLVIKMHPSENNLDEVLIQPSENPAWAIIRKVQENKKANDPQNYAEFQADMYSKTNLDMVAIKPDTNLVKKILPSLFLLENSGKLYQKNKMRKEVISRSINSFPVFIPFNSVSIPDLNPFGFYLPVFNFRIGTPSGIDSNSPNFSFQRLLVNPISENSFTLYDFELQDTILSEHGPQFLISFRPIKGKKFEGLFGSFEIDTTDFAITNVEAKSYDSLQLSNYAIKQKYQKVEGKWYPIERELSVNYTQSKFKQTVDIKLVNEVYLKNIQPKIIDKNIYFDGATKVILPKADTISKEEFGKYRLSPLDSNEVLTLRPWKFEKDPKLKKGLSYLNTMSKMSLSGAVNTKDIIFRNYGTSLGGVQGLNIGVGLQNNLLNYPRIGVNLGVGYSFKLNYWQHLVQGSYFFTKDRYNSFNIFHKRYLDRAGGVELLGPNYSFPRSANLFFLTDSLYLDNVVKTGFSVAVKPARNFQVQFSGYQENRTGKTYNIFGIDNNAITFNNAELSLRFAKKETFIRNGLLETVLNGYFPVVSFNIKKSWSLDNSNFSFWQSNIALTQQFRFKRFGITTFNLKAGIEDGNIPFTHLFNNLSTGVSVFGSTSGISTTDLVSYAYNKYASLLISHNFGKTIFRTKSKWFQPEFSIGHSFTYSKLNNTHKIPGLALKDFSNLYPEASLNISKIVRFNIKGFGVGVNLFMRYGYLSKDSKNFNVRPGLSPVFN